MDNNDTPRPLQQVIDNILKNISKKGVQEAENAQEAKGSLPIPVSQAIFTDRYEWTWHPGKGNVFIKALMNRKDRTWDVWIDTTDNSISLTLEESRAVGEAFLAIWNWQYVWKDHFADLFEGGIGVEVEVGVEVGVKDDLEKKTMEKKAIENAIKGDRVDD